MHQVFGGTFLSQVFGLWEEFEEEGEGKENIGLIRILQKRLESFIADKFSLLRERGECRYLLLIVWHNSPFEFENELTFLLSLCASGKYTAIMYLVWVYSICQDSKSIFACKHTVPTSFLWPSFVFYTLILFIDYIQLN